MTHEEILSISESSRWAYTYIRAFAHHYTPTLGGERVRKILTECTVTGESPFRVAAEVERRLETLNPPAPLAFAAYVSAGYETPPVESLWRTFLSWGEWS